MPRGTHRSCPGASTAAAAALKPGQHGAIQNIDEFRSEKYPPLNTEVGDEGCLRHQEPIF